MDTLLTVKLVYFVDAQRPETWRASSPERKSIGSQDFWMEQNNVCGGESLSYCTFPPHLVHNLTIWSLFIPLQQGWDQVDHGICEHPQWRGFYSNQWWCMSLLHGNQRAMVLFPLTQPEWNCQNEDLRSKSNILRPEGSGFTQQVRCMSLCQEQHVMTDRVTIHYTLCIVSIETVSWDSIDSYKNLFCNTQSFCLCGINSIWWWVFELSIKKTHFLSFSVLVSGHCCMNNLLNGEQWSQIWRGLQEMNQRALTSS